MSQLQIDEVNFIPISPQHGLIGFASVKLFGFLEINSLGTYTRLKLNGEDSSVRLTWPAKKLGEGNYKFYVRITDPKIEKQLERAVQDKIEELGLFNFKTKTKDEKKEKTKFED